MRALYVCTGYMYMCIHVCMYGERGGRDCTCVHVSMMQFSEAPRQMRDKVSQLKGEIGEKTSWDSKYCSELFHRRSVC